jgi:S1-C subfamily serine protease
VCDRLDARLRALRRAPHRGSPLRGLIALAILAWVGYLIATLAGCAAITGACDWQPAQAAVPNPSTPLVAELRDQLHQIRDTVRIEATCGDAVWMGSGTLISATQIITARHVVDCTTGGAITARRLFSRDKYPIHVEFESDPEHDIARAVLAGGARLEDVSAPVVGPSPSVGDHLCFVTGAPLVEIQCGDATGLESPLVVHNATTVPGNSGAGVYDRSGKLVGVVSKYIDCASLAPVDTVFCGGAIAPIEGTAVMP